MLIAVCHTKSGANGERVVHALVDGIMQSGDSPLWVGSEIDLPLLSQCAALVMVCDGHPNHDNSEHIFRSRIITQAAELNLHRLIIETGFLRNIRAQQRGEHNPKMTQWAAGWDGIKRAADYCLDPSCDTDDSRWKALRLPPVPEDGGDRHGNIIVFGQVEGGYAEIGLSLSDEYRKVMDFCRKNLPGVSVFFRPHPLMRRHSLREKHAAEVKQMGYIFERYICPHSMRGARAVVSWSSNASIDAVLAGVPVVCLSDLNIAWDISSKLLSGLQSRWMPRVDLRQQFLNRLSWCQWSESELSDGTAWARLRRKICSQVRA